MSAVGKSTVLAELARRGHRVVDTDEDDWIEHVPVPGQSEPEPVWRADQMSVLLDTREFGTLFVAGTVANQGAFYDRFDAVVLLSAPVDVMLERLATRATNDFGTSPADRARVVADTAAVEPLLRRRATLEVDTRRPLTEVVDAVEAAAGAVGR
ncbi:MAG: AAA family ATPase [Actinotalea sp.]|nr:AAA family ATPase [Actinotalea sp.]